MKRTLLFLCLFTSFHTFSQSNTNTTTIPFTMAESGHLLIHATVEGVEGTFIFDTGAGLNLFFDKFVKKLKPKEKTYHFFTAHRATGEALTIPLYHSDRLTIGTVELKDQLYSTFDLDMPGIDGLISLQAFQNLPFIIDYDKKELTIGELKAADRKNPIDIQIEDMEGKALDMFTTVKINDKLTIQVLLDAGAGKNSFWLNNRFIGMLGLDSSSFKVIKKKSEFDSTRFTSIYIGTIGRIATENALSRVERPNVWFVEGLIYEGKTSIEWLGRRIAVSVPEKKIYLVRPALN